MNINRKVNLSQTKKIELPFFFNSFRFLYKLGTYEGWKNKTGGLNISKQVYTMNLKNNNHCNCNQSVELSKNKYKMNLKKQYLF